MTTTRDYLTCAESAKLLRAALKTAFPATKFTVRSKTYAGGASIRVGWTDGPSSERVNRVLARFEGADFDGMIDLKSSKESILCDADGNIRTVRFGSDFVFGERRVSPELNDAIIAKLCAGYVPDSWNRMPSYERERLAWRAVNRLDIPDGEPLDVTASRAAALHFSNPNAV